MDFPEESEPERHCSGPEPIIHESQNDFWWPGSAGNCLDTDDHFDENPD